MSAPNTNLEKQAKRHRGPLTGMAMVVTWALVLLVGLVIFLAVRGGTPQGADTQVQTGAPETGATTTGGTGAPATDDVDGTNATATENPAAPLVPAETQLDADSAATLEPQQDPETDAAVPSQTPPVEQVDEQATVPGPENESDTVGSPDN